MAMESLKQRLEQTLRRQEAAAQTTRQQLEEIRRAESDRQQLQLLTDKPKKP